MSVTDIVALVLYYDVNSIYWRFVPAKLGELSPQHLSRKFDAYALALVSSFSIRAVSCVKVSKGGLLENEVKILLVLVILTFD